MQSITRRSALTAFGAPLIARAATEKLNFVFLLADDHAGYAWGADGDPIASTPNLDRLANSGVRFSRHFCNSPVCTPSRQCLLTGQLPHSAGVTRLMTPLDESKPTLARQFKKAGYTTAVFGKMHFQRPAKPGLHGFDTCITEDVLTSEWRKQVQPRPLPAGVSVKPPWKPFRDPARIWLNAEKLPYGCIDEDMRASFQVRAAERFLEDHRSGPPFALWVSFLEPHSPYDFPFEDRERFSPSRFAVRRPSTEDLWQIPMVFRDLGEADERGIAAAYYTSVHFLDRKIGSVLAKLNALGLDRNTVVVYTADHGYHIGQHGRFEKHCGFDEALRVPLVIRHPNMRPGVVKALTEHVDLSATITDICGLEPLPVQHGRSLRPLLQGGTTGREHIFSEYLENEEAYIRSDRWKFIYCSGKRARQDGYIVENSTPGRYWRLYDLDQDPSESHSVAGDHPRVVADLKGLLLDRFRATHPDATSEPARASHDEALDFYLRPRDA